MLVALVNLLWFCSYPFSYHWRLCTKFLLHQKPQNNLLNDSPWFRDMKLLHFCATHTRQPMEGSMDFPVTHREYLLLSSLIYISIHSLILLAGQKINSTCITKRLRIMHEMKISEVSVIGQTNKSQHVYKDTASSSEPRSSQHHSSDRIQISLHYNM